MKSKSEATKGYIEILLAGSLWGCIGPFMQGMSNMGAGSGLISLMRQGFGFLFIFCLSKKGRSRSTVPFLI